MRGGRDHHEGRRHRADLGGGKDSGPRDEDREAPRWQGRGGRARRATPDRDSGERPPATWPGLTRAWIWCDAPWRRPGAQPAARARTSAARPGIPCTRGRGNRRRSWSGPGPDARDPQSAGSATRDVARARGWSARVAEGAVFGRWPAVVGEQIAGPRDADRTERGCAEGFRGIDGVGNPAEDGPVATYRQDRRRSRRRRREIAEDRRSGRAVVAQRPLPHRRPRTPRHLRMSLFPLVAQSRENAASVVLKRLDAPRIEKFHRRR